MGYVKPFSKMVTKKDLLNKFKELGIKPGMIIEVHCALSNFGYVCGGAKTVIDALIETIGYTGTLIMANHATENSEPTKWINPPINLNLAKSIRKNMPAFNKHNYDNFHMGKVANNLRMREGVIVSDHPTYSYLAWGKYAKLLCNRHSLHFPLSEESPTARLVELKASMLLLGVDFDCATCLHLAEYRADCRSIELDGAAIIKDGKRKWEKYLNLALNSEVFLDIQKILAKKEKITEIKINDLSAKLVRIDVAMDYAVNYLESKSIYQLYYD